MQLKKKFWNDFPQYLDFQNKWSLWKKSVYAYLMTLWWIVKIMFQLFVVFQLEAIKNRLK